MEAEALAARPQRGHAVTEGHPVSLCPARSLTLAACRW
jgi:hypothetical protein